MIDHGVYMAGSTLKPNIVNPGRDCPLSYSIKQIAEAIVLFFEQSFPVAMKGSNYLSGGQTLSQAAARLSAINKAKKKAPWNTSFSWSQALQLPLLDLCKGKGELQFEEMSKLYVDELKIASAAAKGKYEWASGDGDHVGKMAGISAGISTLLSTSKAESSDNGGKKRKALPM
jgi:fructose-bisphosphate aldolase class I